MTVNGFSRPSLQTQSGMCGSEVSMSLSLHMVLMESLRLPDPIVIYIVVWFHQCRKWFGPFGSRSTANTEKSFTLFFTFCILRVQLK